MPNRKPARSPRLVRLRYIYRCPFTKSEKTNFAEAADAWAQASSEPLRLGPDDVVLLVSSRGDQLIFVSGYIHWNSAGQSLSALESWRLRLDGPWNPLMLADYAKERGLSLIGIKTFAEHYEAERLAKAERRAH